MSELVSRRRHAILGSLAALLRSPTSAIGTILALFFLFLACFGAQLAPHPNPNDQSHSPRLPPTLEITALQLGEHPFGTDRLGRDVYSRVILGAGSIFRIAGLGTLISVVFGAATGLLMGYRGGTFDEVLGRVIDALLAIPALLLALVMVGIIRKLDVEIGSWQAQLADNVVLIVIAILYVPIVARVARSATLDIKTREFVEAAEIRGESTGYILFREILPSVIPALVVEASLRFSYAIFLVASLGFLGFGARPPSPDWGLMVNENRGGFYQLTPWALEFPALAIAILVIAVNLMSDGIRRLGAEGRLSMDHGRDPLLDIDGLSVSYRLGKRWVAALRDFRLRLERGQILGLVGESGSGKSTAARALMRHLAGNGRIERGARMLLSGEDLLTKNAAEMRSIWARRIKLTPQNAGAALNPSIRIGEQVIESLQAAADLDRPSAQDAMMRMFADVNLVDPERVARRYPHELSGGMQQRVMIAMALICEPELLILDEPTTGLDVTTQAVILDLIRRLIREREAGVITITHNLGVVAQLCQRVIVLYAGEIMEDADVEALFHKPLNPYTLGLLRSLPKPGQNKREAPLHAIAGNRPGLTPLDATSARPGCVFADRCDFVIDICRSTKPALEALPGGRRSRCHRWRELAAGGLRLGENRESLGIASAAGRGDTLLQVRGMSKHFPAARSFRELLRREEPAPIRAVDGVDLSLRAGQTLGLVGESGSGKTTLARLIIGLEERSGGGLELLGMDIRARARDRSPELLSKLQMVFQNPQNALNPYMTVRQAISRPLVKLRGMRPEQAEEATLELLRRVNLREDYADRRPDALSGGEKQRVVIARAFASQPELIICDEPVSALDVSVQSTVLNLLASLQARHGSAYLFISHDLGSVGYLADAIAVMYLGQLFEIGTDRELFRAPFHPYTEALVSAIPRADPRQRSQRVLLNDALPSAQHLPSGCRFHTRCPRKIGDICEQEPPPWQEAGAGHLIRCHIPLDELLELQSPGDTRDGDSTRAGAGG